ncbi:MULTISPECIES: hypothetical protein [unclassified Mycolicibacterium]|uniref:hypothetical protein n=1 Tax=unclassified Mycolicibacterium TaxID=2636767 RepID=UPI001F4C2637|nr:hypothetical protein [Mycolicibacterium sp. YH-1]UNB52446.1 hypothetical protein L0M16_32165 [Mycolicibacterium sp. YH-1]
MTTVPVLSWQAAIDTSTRASSARSNRAVRPAEICPRSRRVLQRCVTGIGTLPGQGGIAD